jgi:hypothetical protein
MGQLIMKKRFIKLVLAAGVISLLYPVFGRIAVSVQKPTIVKRSTYYHGHLKTYKGIPVQLTMGSIADFGGLEGMMTRSDLIVIGKVEKTIEEAGPTVLAEVDGVVDAVTYVPLTIKKVFKGDASLKNTQIVLGQQAAVLKDKKGNPYASVFESFAPFQKGKYLLFLNRSADGKAYFPVGVFFGKHNLDGTDPDEERTSSEEIKNIRKIVKEKFKDDK